jgi:hypothetical protein
MKYSSPLLSLTCITALALAPVSAFAQSTKASPSPGEKSSPAAKTSESSSAKPPRAIPLTGKVSEVDSSAKTFTIAGKTASRVFKITDRSTVTKDGAAATFDEIAVEGKVTGSYWKQEDGTLEIKTLKIGGPGTSEKSPSKKSKKKAAAADEEESGDASASPSPSPKK